MGLCIPVSGCFLGFLTHGLVKIKSLTTHRLAMAVNKVIYLDNWKTGYGVHAYWPLSWE